MDEPTTESFDPDQARDCEPDQQWLEEFEAERRELANGHADEVPF
jgi:hypothetical protein